MAWHASTTAPTRRRRTTISGAPHTPIEPRSLTDARARVDQALAPPPAIGAPTSLLGVPSMLLAADVLVVYLAVAFVTPQQVRYPLLWAVAMVLSRACARQYRPRLNLSALDDVPRILAAAVAGIGFTVGITYFADNPPSGRLLLEPTLLFLAGSLVLEVGSFAVLRRIRRARLTGRRTLIVGAGRIGRTVAQGLLLRPEVGLRPVGFADPEGNAREIVTSTVPGGLSAELPVLNRDLAKLPAIISEHTIDTVILALSGADDDYVDAMITVHQTGCDLLLVPSMFELHHDGADVERVSGVPLLRLRPDPTLRPSWWLKRALDILVAGFALILLAVPLALVAVAVRISNRGPVLFWQERVGLDGETFRLCKFCTMRPLSDNESQSLWNIGNDPRVTKLGRMLRRTSIDELPQLWNILRGQMSLVGPRPERPLFVEKFSAEHERYWARHRVPVGLTGLAQVNGLRGDTSIRERARYDNYYIANWSLWLDLKILLLTTREVLGGRGR